MPHFAVQYEYRPGNARPRPPFRVSAKEGRGLCFLRHFIISKCLASGSDSLGEDSCLMADLAFKARLRRRVDRSAVCPPNAGRSRSLSAGAKDGLLFGGQNARSAAGIGSAPSLPDGRLLRLCFASSQLSDSASPGRHQPTSLREALLSEKWSRTLRVCLMADFCAYASLLRSSATRLRPGGISRPPFGRHFSPRSGQERSESA